MSLTHSPLFPDLGSRAKANSARSEVRFYSYFNIFALKATEADLTSLHADASSSAFSQCFTYFLNIGG
jgi:hypothetical protein